jgi:NitT/TauT family transport system ATP-binding protein
MRLRVENLTVTFDRKGGEPLRVLDRVTFEARPGEFVALVGPSGCGKTTILRCIAGLQEVSTGLVTIGEKRLEGVDRGVAMVFQSDSLFPWRTVWANIAFGLEIRRYDRATIRQVVRDLIGLVGLIGFEDAYPHQLSGGMRQRVNLARALAVDPHLLLMDEPFSALDMLTRMAMQGELLRIWSSKRKTVLFVTHQVEEAVFLADRVLLLSSRPGRVWKDVPVPFGRPRDDRLRHTPEFHAVVDALAETLSEIMSSSDSRAQEV